MRFKNIFSVIFLGVMLIAGFKYFSSHQKNKIVIGNGKNGPQGMVLIPRGEFMMGSESRLAKPNEKPAHKVHLNHFWIDQTDVTNKEFTAFVKATGYVTTAERKPDWNTLKV